jgi:hypothetical protein
MDAMEAEGERYDGGGRLVLMKLSLSSVTVAAFGT